MIDTIIAGRLINFAYGIYAWGVLVIVFIPALLILIITPTQLDRRRITRWFARAVFLLVGSSIRIEKGSNLPEGPCVVVANHSSYIDGMILAASLPANFTFVITQRMARFPVAGYFLRRIGSEFVSREDNNQRHRVARKLFKAAQSGDALAFFPEGTFDDRPGLKPFKLGAFGAALRGQIPIVPIVIFGARAKLSSQMWLPTPGALSISILEAIEPNNHDSALSLMTTSRDAILAQLNEPDLTNKQVSDGLDT